MILLIGIFIGLIGYVMVNNINLSIIEISGQGKPLKLCLFIGMTLLMEGVYSFCSLYGLKMLMDYPIIISVAQYLSVAFLFIIGFAGLFERKSSEAVMQQNLIRRGYWSIFIHPQQIPFWFFWGIILIKKDLLQTNVPALILFSLANMLGAFIILYCYAKFGAKIVSKLNVKRKQLKNLVSIICIISGGFLLYDIFVA